MFRIRIHLIRSGSGSRYIYLSLGFHKGRPSNRRSPKPSKENIQHIKSWNSYFFLFLLVTFALLDPDTDPLIWLNPDPNRIRIRKTEGEYGWTCYTTSSPRSTVYEHRSASMQGSNVQEITAGRRCRDQGKKCAGNIWTLLQKLLILTYLTMFFRARSDTSWDFTGLNGNTQILSI